VIFYDDDAADECFIHMYNYRKTKYTVIDMFAENRAYLTALVC